MKKIVRPCAKTMHMLTVLTGFLTGLGIIGYYLADYPQTLVDTIQHSLPYGDSILRWLITI